MKIYSLSLFNEEFSLSDFLFPINKVLLLNQPCTFNPVVIAPMKKNPMNNHTSLSKNIKGERA